MKIYVYNFSDLTLIDCLDTCFNPYGLCALNPDSGASHAVLAIPHTDKGKVKVVTFIEKGVGMIVPCHQGSIAAMALNKKGDLLATASEKGTLVRLWKVGGDKPLAVAIFRRGNDKADISHLQFSKNSTYLSVSSDHNTIHIFQIDQTSQDQAQEVHGADEEQKEDNQKQG